MIYKNDCSEFGHIMVYREYSVLPTFATCLFDFKKDIYSLFPLSSFRRHVDRRRKCTHTHTHTHKQTHTHTHIYIYIYICTNMKQHKVLRRWFSLSFELFINVKRFGFKTSNLHQGVWLCNALSSKFYFD